RWPERELQAERRGGRCPGRPAGAGAAGEPGPGRRRWGRGSGRDLSGCAHGDRGTGHRCEAVRGPESGRGEEPGSRGEPEAEERVAALEAEVARLKQERNSSGMVQRPWWEEIWGTFKDDTIYAEAMRLGREYREALRPKNDEEAEA